MFSKIIKLIRRKTGRSYTDINPEDIFLDSANLPGFDEYSLEGRIERPIDSRTFFFVRAILIFVTLGLVFQLWNLGVKDGKIYADISDNNRLEQTIIFANRGIIYDRNLVEMATNGIKGEGDVFASRIYPRSGSAHVVGYIKYPSRDAKGIFYDTEYHGKDGVELVFDEILKGMNGLKLTETDVQGNITSESVIDEPSDGSPVVLSLDAKVNEVLQKAIKDLAQVSGFVGGAGVIMDTRTGEILALTSYPEYDENLVTAGVDKKAINSLLNSSSKPFLNRVTSGLYTPGSIIKPILALAALKEGIISPNKEIYSSGSITVANPYDPSKPTIYNDWRAHGYTAMREAIAVSSDTYFYSIGGGYKDQKGLGIERIDKYLKLFAFGNKTGISLPGEISGIIPTPEWKRENFDGDIWRLGDTYITSIGQYGTQITPLEAVRFTAAIANKGTLLVPSLLSLSHPQKAHNQNDGRSARVEFSENEWDVVHEGMREAVTYGTAVGLNVPYVEVAAKTGTAEIGAAKRYVHSWSVGFFPFENPKYAFAVVMEKGPSSNSIGATSVMRYVLDWMNIYAQEYLK